MAMLLSSPPAYGAWDGISDAQIDFNAAALGISRRNGSNQMARLMETLNLQRGLLRRLREQPNVTLLDNTKVMNIFEDDIPGGGWPMVQLSDGVTLRARLLVGSATVWDIDLADIWYGRSALMVLTPRSVLIPRLTRTAGTTLPPPSSPLSYTLPGLSRPTHAPTNAFCQQGPSLFSHSPQLRLPLCGPLHQH